MYSSSSNRCLRRALNRRSEKLAGVTGGERSTPNPRLGSSMRSSSGWRLLLWVNADEIDVADPKRRRQFIKAHDRRVAPSLLDATDALLAELVGLALSCLIRLIYPSGIRGINATAKFGSSFPSLASIYRRLARLWLSSVLPLSMQPARPYRAR